MKDILYAGIIVAEVLLLVACSRNEPEPVVKSSKTLIYKGLEGCQRFVIGELNRSWDDEIVYRCPNSSTSVKYNCGKNCTATNMVIENEEQTDGAGTNITYLEPNEVIINGHRIQIPHEQELNLSVGE